jgi:DNA-binding ferritin-like protein (Dps family)
MMGMMKFFDKYLNVKKIMQEKREYKAQRVRVKTLPEDYQFVFAKIQGYMWRFAKGDGMDMLKIQYDLIDLFEAGAADGRHVLEITGEDVAGFCDELLRNAQTWTREWPEKLNRAIIDEFGKERG